MTTRTQNSRNKSASKGGSSASLPPPPSPQSLQTVNRPPAAVLAEEYAKAVVAGHIPVGKWVRLAAQRHLDDLQRSATDPSYPYYYDEEKGALVCEFIECLPHVKGKWAAKHERIKLQGWQCFIVCCIFGWLRRSDSKRRFRAAYLAVPRKNGKSVLAAGIGLYMLMADGEFGAEVYSGATTERQAWEVFGPARLMMYRTPDMANELGVEVWTKALKTTADGGKFVPVIGNPGDGPSPSCAIVDEYHEHDTPIQHDTMETGMGAREQPLLLVITTAGYNIAGPCHEKQDEVCKVLEGTFENDQQFACIYSPDEKDDWADPNTLIKANPNYGVSVDMEFLQAQQRAAMANPIQQNKFKTKHLNIWCSVLTGWMNMQLWKAAGDPLLNEDDFVGCDSVFSIDLASKSDLCSEQRLYWKVLPGSSKPHYYLFGRYWLPEATIEEAGPNHSHYKKWVVKNLLTQTEGATVDFDLITKTVIEDAKEIKPREIVYDPYNATQMAQAFMAEEIEAVEFTQTPQNFAIPMDELESALKDGRFHHDGNEITTWCMSNVVARPCRKGLFSPSKSKPHQKIDGAIAAIMAMGRACALNEPEKEYQMLFG